jgi:hypothetical protein
MVNKTLLSTTNSERPSSRQDRKYSPTDIGDFAGFMNVHAEQFFRQFQDFGRETSKLNASQIESQDASMKKMTTDDSRSDRSSKKDAKDSNVHNTSDESADNTTRSSSKAEGSEQTTQSVDGGETNSTPGASTEAAVNAQSNSASENSAESQLTDPTQTSQQAAELQQLLQKVAGESTTTQVADENKTSIKISAKSVESNNPNLQTNLNLTTQQIIFEAGLAEHFVRLLTDQFDQLKNSNTQKTDSTQTDAASQTANVSLSSVTTDTSKTNLNLSFPTATPSQSPENQATENMTKIMHIIRSNLGRRQSQLTVRLDPPELGKMQVDVKVIDNNLNLSIITETAEAKQMLSSRMETLRNSLEQSGITLSKFEITTKSETAGQNQNDQQYQDQSRNGNGSFQQQQQSSNFASDSDASSQTSPAEDSADSISTITGVNSSDENLNLVA